MNVASIPGLRFWHAAFGGQARAFDVDGRHDQYFGERESMTRG